MLAVNVQLLAEGHLACEFVDREIETDPVGESVNSGEAEGRRDEIFPCLAPRIYRSNFTFNSAYNDTGERGDSSFTNPSPGIFP